MYLTVLGLITATPQANPLDNGRSLYTHDRLLDRSSGRDTACMPSRLGQTILRIVMRFSDYNAKPVVGFSFARWSLITRPLATLFGGPRWRANTGFVNPVNNARLS